MIQKQCSDKVDVKNAMQCAMALPIFERAAKLAHDLDVVSKAATHREVWAKKNLKSTTKNLLKISFRFFREQTKFLGYLTTIIGDLMKLLVGSCCIIPVSWKRPTGCKQKNKMRVKLRFFFLLLFLLLADPVWAFDHGDEGAILLVVHKRTDSIVFFFCYYFTIYIFKFSFLSMYSLIL